MTTIVAARQGRFLTSAREMKKGSTLAICGVLVAVTLVLDLLTVRVLDYMHVSFEFATYAMVGQLFGPVTGGLFGIASDLLCFLVYPKGAYFPGYTITAFAQGFLWGLFLYRRRITWPRIIISRTATQFLCNICMNTLWSTLLYGQGFFAILPARILKNIALLPVEIALTYFVLHFITSKVYCTTVERTLAPQRRGGLKWGQLALVAVTSAAFIGAALMLYSFYRP